jgi:hypothetical protein
MEWWRRRGSRGEPGHQGGDSGLMSGRRGQSWCPDKGNVHGPAWPRRESRLPKTEMLQYQTEITHISCIYAEHWDRQTDRHIESMWRRRIYHQPTYKLSVGTDVKTYPRRRVTNRRRDTSGLVTARRSECRNISSHFLSYFCFTWINIIYCDGHM